MAVQIQFRRDLSSTWTSVNPILSQGELGLETDTIKFKMGDGVNHWNDLDYASGVQGDPGTPIEIQKGVTHIQWRYVGDPEWIDLVALADIKGDQGIQGAPGLDITWLGAYNPLTTYIVNDAVSYLGSSYICILESTGNLPTNPTYWNLMAEEGEGIGTHEATYDHSLLHSNSLDHSNVNDPTASQKLALPGTDGTPSGTNKYVTDSDPRNTNARTPVAHNQDASTINAGTLDGDRLPAMSATKKGGVPATGTPSGKFLKDDATWGSAGGVTPVPTYSWNSGGVAVAVNKLMMDLFNATGSGKTIKIFQIEAYVRNTAGVSGVSITLEVHRTTDIGTAGTPVAVDKIDPNDLDLPVEITCRSAPTGGATITGNPLAAGNVYTEEVANSQPQVPMYQNDGMGTRKRITIPENSGIRITTGPLGGAGTIAIRISAEVS